MLRGMEGLVFGIQVDHGEGLLHFPDPAIASACSPRTSPPWSSSTTTARPTERYPFNPNGSPGGLTGVTSPDGRHFAMMPHPERCFLPWQAHWLPEKLRRSCRHAVAADVPERAGVVRGEAGGLITPSAGCGKYGFFSARVRAGCIA